LKNEERLEQTRREQEARAKQKRQEALRREQEAAQRQEQERQEALRREQEATRRQEQERIVNPGVAVPQVQEDDPVAGEEESPETQQPALEAYDPTEYSSPSWVEQDDVTWPRGFLGFSLLIYERIHLAFPNDSVVSHHLVPFPMVARAHFYYWTDYVGFGVEAFIVAGLWSLEVSDLSPVPQTSDRYSDIPVKDVDGFGFNWFAPELFLGFRLSPDGFLSRLVLYASSRHSSVSSDDVKNSDMSSGKRSLKLSLHRVGGGLALKIAPWLTLRAVYFHYLGQLDHYISWYDRGKKEMEYGYTIGIHAAGAHARSLIYAGENFTIRFEGWFHLGVGDQTGGNLDGGFYALGLSGALGYRW